MCPSLFRQIDYALMTHVSSAKSGTKSLKTIIPEGIVGFLELSYEDELELENGSKQQ